ncbi:CgeB family protein [Terriglobus albidus]|uniref:CgeB family protein n=1 Tax=Terriglobus albidus TaxID=1592106 RepID=UPI0021E04ED1|nr:glycosyltransferase [Terriglobus albidus]
MKIFAVGSSILSSYWNGAATYYRGIYKYLAKRGHEIVFAEPDAFGRQQHLDEGDFSYVRSIVYQPGTEEEVIDNSSDADIVIKHSGVGTHDVILERLVANLAEYKPSFFWDVDSPATIARLTADPADPFLTLIPCFDAILSYGGGPESCSGYSSFGAQAYYNVYNALDPETHYPVPPVRSYDCDLVFLGNRLPDREKRVDELFLTAAEQAPEKRFVLGGEGWADKTIPQNVRWIGHVPTEMHNAVNCSAGFVMNINRSSMASFGFSPPTRMFEGAGAGACMICDDWKGIDDCFEPGKEVLVVQTASDVVKALRETSPVERRQIGKAALQRALRQHTYARRAQQVEKIFREHLHQRSQTIRKVPA